MAPRNTDLGEINNLELLGNFKVRALFSIIAIVILNSPHDFPFSYSFIFVHIIANVK